MDLLGEVRQARRRTQSNLYCRLDRPGSSFPIHELSAHGFSFLCLKADNQYHKWQGLEKITISNAEGVEIIAGSGVVVHVTAFDFLHRQVGVFFTRKTFDRSIAGAIRVPRHFPKVRLDASVAKLEEGEPMSFLGYVKDFTATTARIHLSQSADNEIQVGDELTIDISTAGRNLFSSPAVVVRKDEEGFDLCLRFIGGFFDVSQVETLSNASQNGKVILSALHSLAANQNLPHDYKALVCDWRMYLSSLKRVLDQEEAKKIYNLPSDQEALLSEIEPEVFKTLNGFIERLNVHADDLKPEVGALYKSYFSENLRPFLRAAPLIASIIDKDLGYNGDFETIKQFFQEPYRGDSLFGKLLNKYLCSLPAVSAHRARIDYLFEELRAHYHASRDEFSFLVLGSGPAEEVLRFVETTKFDRPVRAMLCDMDAFALSDFSERLQYLPKDNFLVELINLNILHIVRRKQHDPVSGQFKLLYCAGLFDYFRKSICQKILDYLLRHAAPGGTIIITNVHKNNFARHFMDYGGDWSVIHRDEEAMREIVPGNLPVHFLSDRDKTNIFMKISAPL